MILWIPSSLLLFEKKCEKRMRRIYRDLELLTKTVKSSLLPRQLCLMLDCSELERQFLTGKVCQTLKEFKDLFISMHLSDQGCVNFASTPKVLRFQFNIPPVEDMEKMKKLMTMAIQIVDLVASKKLSLQFRKRALAKRKACGEQLSREYKEQVKLMTRKDEEKRRSGKEE